MKCCSLGACSVSTIQPCTSSQCHFIQSHIGRVYACLAVTCHLHFWQNDRGLLRATALTRGWNGYRNKSQHRKLTLEKNLLHGDSNPRPFSHESGALTTGLSRRFGAGSVYTIQPCTRLQCHFIQSHIGRVYACLAVTCNLHFWQNDRDILRATVVTRR